MGRDATKGPLALQSTYAVKLRLTQAKQKLQHGARPGKNITLQIWTRREMCSGLFDPRNHDVTAIVGKLVLYRMETSPI